MTVEEITGNFLVFCKCSAGSSSGLEALQCRCGDESRFLGDPGSKVVCGAAKLRL